MTVNNKEYTQWKKTHKRKRAILAICLTAIGVGVGIGIGCAIWFKEAGLSFSKKDIPDGTNLKGKYLQIKDANFPMGESVGPTSLYWYIYAKSGFYPVREELPKNFIGIFGEGGHYSFAYNFTDDPSKTTLVGSAQSSQASEKFQWVSNKPGDIIEITTDTNDWTWQTVGTFKMQEFEKCLSAQRILDKKP